MERKGNGGKEIILFKTQHSVEACLPPLIGSFKLVLLSLAFDSERQTHLSKKTIECLGNTTDDPTLRSDILIAQRRLCFLGP